MLEKAVEHKLMQAAELAKLHLALYVRNQQVGKVYAAETGFLLSRNPDTVRAPDAAFSALIFLFHRQCNMQFIQLLLGHS